MSNPTAMQRKWSSRELRSSDISASPGRRELQPDCESNRDNRQGLWGFSRSGNPQEDGPHSSRWPLGEPAPFLHRREPVRNFPPHRWRPRNRDGSSLFPAHAGAELSQSGPFRPGVIANPRQRRWQPAPEPPRGRHPCDRLPAKSDCFQRVRDRAEHSRKASSLSTREGIRIPPFSGFIFP